MVEAIFVVPDSLGTVNCQPIQYPVEICTVLVPEGQYTCAICTVPGTVQYDDVVPKRKRRN